MIPNSKAYLAISISANAFKDIFFFLNAHAMMMPICDERTFGAKPLDPVRRKSPTDAGRIADLKENRKPSMYFSEGG